MRRRRTPIFIWDHLRLREARARVPPANRDRYIRVCSEEAASLSALSYQRINSHPDTIWPYLSYDLDNLRYTEEMTKFQIILYVLFLYSFFFLVSSVMLHNTFTVNSFFRMRNANLLQIVKWYEGGSKSFRPDIQKRRQMENTARDI
jgi:hypothetical protein